MTLNIAVSGATGRLGSFICEVVEEHPDCRIVARLDSRSSAEAGADADVLIDATRLEVSQQVVGRALERGQRVIIGTSGYSEKEIGLLRARVEASPGAAALVVPNFSLGSVLGTMLASFAAPFFDSIEIIEAHHAGKVDSPSGTAVRTAELIGSARGTDTLKAPFSEQPARGQVVAGIPVHSLRMQGVIARQEVRFGGAGEELAVTHVTHSRDSYRAGIRAAIESIERIVGLVVGLENVLGLDHLGARGAGAAGGIVREPGYDS